MATDDREKLLLQMYDQMFNDINCHIIVVWQSVGVLIGAFAILALTEKQVIGLDMATSLIVVIAGWLLAHLHDASYWYNRNLAIIANIEKEFLQKDDLKKIHYYFGTHRPGKMITHLRIQYALGVGIGAVVVGFHFLTRVAPGFGLPIKCFDPQRSLPYLCLLLVIIYVVHLHWLCGMKYKEFLGNSPGKTVDVSGITYGSGHGFSVKSDRKK